DDARIAEEILDELELRGVRPTSGSTGDHIVLLSERDTFFGRMLSLTYGAALARRLDPARSRHEFVQKYIAGGDLPGSLHTFVSLRGLDGLTVSAAGNADADKMKPVDQTRNRPDSIQELIQWRPEANKAEGPGQFDYLSRTGDLIEALQTKLHR